MRRIRLVLLRSLISCLGLGITTGAGAAEPERPARPKPLFGQVVAVTDDSLTVAVEPPPAPRPRAKRGEAPAPAPAPAPPAEHVFALSKDDTEVVFAEVRREMMMADGTTVRIFDSAYPATAADLKPGVSVAVTAEDGAASRIIIPWGVAGVLERVAADSVTFRPHPANADAADGVPPEQTLNAGQDTTKVTFEVAAAPVRTPGGQLRTGVQYVRAGLADLKPGQHVVVCAKDGAALKIRVLEPEPDAAGAN